MKKILMTLFIFVWTFNVFAQRFEYETIQINYLSLMGFDSIGSNWGNPKKIPCYVEFTMDNYISLRVVDQEGNIYYKYNNIPMLVIYADDDYYSIFPYERTEDEADGEMINIHGEKSDIEFMNPMYEDAQERMKQIELKIVDNLSLQRQNKKAMELLVKNLLTYKGKTLVKERNLNSVLKNIGYEK